MPQDHNLISMAAEDALATNGPQADVFFASFPGYQQYPTAQNSYYPIQAPAVSAEGSSYQYPTQYPTTSYAYYPTPTVAAGPTYVTASPYEMTPSTIAPGLGSSNALYNATLPSSQMSSNRDLSPNDVSAYGYQNVNGTWTCNYPGCSSEAVIRRACDLRKHYKRHVKTLFCGHEGCPQSEAGAGEGGGFSTKKDRERHERSHEPNIRCEYPGCSKVGSRADNMRDHYRRKHGQR
ncbi:MAG: hypothetical protein M1814_003743 [Vezdaea aestivalis]|nr:MAG: hypothetical protein M1814_003743 [Vezdaea aestivalis]